MAKKKSKKKATKAKAKGKAAPKLGPGEPSKVPNQKLISIGKLHPDPENVQDHGPESVEAIAASLAEYGQQKPIVLDGRLELIAGHGNVLAAQGLGWSKMWAVVSDLEGARRLGYAIADNQTSKHATWNENLKVNVAKIAEAGGDLTALGFSPSALEALRADDEDGGASDPTTPDGGSEGGGNDPVRFQFGEYAGLVEAHVYEEFRQNYEDAKDEGHVLLSDIVGLLLAATTGSPAS